MKTYKIHIIRHGITQGNLDGRYIGVTDVPLCDEGINELEQLSNNYEYPFVDKVYSSPLTRCLSTAQIIYPDTQLEKVNDLIEYNFGVFEGRSIHELKHDAVFLDWFNSKMAKTPPQGEEKENFDLRCDNAFLYVLKDMMKNKYYNAAIITHGGVIMSLLSRHGLPRYSSSELFVANGRGYSISCTAQLWGMGEVFEIYETIPFGDDQTHNVKGYDFRAVKNK